LDNKQENETNEEESKVEKLDFNEPDFSFIPKGDCQYRQQGPYLICYSCELQHAVYIGMDKMMVGVGKDGKPILEKRVFKQG